MSPKTIKSNLELGEAIKNRRSELNLTIEEAASKAGISTKTWSRYESGESIRKDKVSGLCKALKWRSIPGMDDVGVFTEADFDKYKESKAWSPYIAECFGPYAALSFVFGSDILLDHINEDISALSEMPRGSHIGEVPTSFIASSMPQQFLVRYDYEFMWSLREILIRFRRAASHTEQMVAHSVIEELVLYLINEESQFLMEEMELAFDVDHDEDEYRADWVFDIFDDADIETFLYSDVFSLVPDDTYHFDNWFEQQFFIPEEESSLGKSMQ